MNSARQRERFSLIHSGGRNHEIFIDTAKVEDIKAANDMGIICGVTTNPSLIAKEGRDFNEVIKEITRDCRRTDQRRG